MTTEPKVHDHGHTTKLQEAQWDAHIKSQPREYSSADRFFTSRITFFAALFALVALLTWAGCAAIGRL